MMKLRRLFASRRSGIATVVLVLVVGSAAFIGVRAATNDCTSYEQYSLIRGECYFTCDSDAQCADISAKVDAELNQYYTSAQTKSKAVSTNKPKVSSQQGQPTQDAKSTGSDTNGTVYTIDKTTDLSPQPNDQDKDLWALFVRVAGKDAVSQYLETFEVFDDKNNTSAASVWQSDTPGKWHMNVNAAYKDDRKDLVRTMVHEYSHIVSLNTSQVETTTGACPRLQLSEGCSRQGSYIGAFQAKFWAKYGDDVPAKGGENQDDVTAFYDKHPNAFVTEYAASNAVEDFAETFATFALGQRPTGTSEKDQKVGFMYDYPALVSLRNSIRANLASEIK